MSRLIDCAHRASRWNVCLRLLQQYATAITGVIGLVGAATITSAATLTPADDTYLTEHSGLGGPNSAHGSDTSLYSIINSLFTSQPMMRFDLSAFTGQTVADPATLSLYVQGTAAWPQSTRTLVIYRQTVAWNGATANWNTIFTSEDEQLSLFSLDYPTPGDRYVSATLPASVVQEWIDTPATNYGVWFRLLGSATINDLQFGSMETANPPTLTFAVPEPASLGLIGLGSMVLLRRRGRVGVIE